MLSFFKKKPLMDVVSQKRVVTAIQEAERRTSGEIRVFVESQCKFMNPMERARELFTLLKMDTTQERNGVIIYVALKDRQFALFGDSGIYEKSGGRVFWQASAEHLKHHLKQNQLAEGLCQCIHEMGAALAEHFPYDADTDTNELPDDIIFGK